MFDMQYVGKAISRLRKEKNMTQMELADRLGISFQAVSNWERGQTMPDISKLGELAEIMGVSVDELLGNKKSGRMVEQLIRQEPLAQELSPEEFFEVAPLVKPDQAEKLFHQVQADVSMADLIKAAPFLSESTLDALAKEAIKKDSSFESVIGLMPFLSQEAVDACVKSVAKDGWNVKKIVMAAPYLSEAAIDQLADQALLEGGITDLLPLAPFLSQEKLTEAAAKSIEKFGFSKIVPLMPFLDRGMLDSFVMDTWKKKG